MHNKGCHLNYATLKRLFSGIESKDEKEQLVDNIISLYNVIDYEKAIEYFGSYEDMLEADRVSKGAEHDIRETFTGKTDSVYSTMVRIILNSGRFKDVHEVLTLPAEEKLYLYGLLCQNTGAHPDQVAKFLRIPRGGKAADYQEYM